ncbi:MAG: ABC transporter permease [Candidatus Hodarchaeales archaeon]|jgi:ABC-type lipoprotein release transport system permease subunit
MAPQSFSVKYAIRAVWRRKVRNLYTILAIGLGVSLLLGVQVSIAASAAGWENLVIRQLGDAEAEMIPNRTSTVNESTAWALNRAADNLPSIKAITGRLYLGTTAFAPESGQLTLGTLLMGVPWNESGFGEYKDEEGGATINLYNDAQLGHLPPQYDYNITGYLSDSGTGYETKIVVNSPLLIGKTLAEELGIRKNDFIQLFWKTGNYSFYFAKRVDFIYKNENRGREANSYAVVLRLDALQSLVAYAVESNDPINSIRVNFADSVDTKEKGEAALKELEEATDNLGEEYPRFYSTYFSYSNTKFEIVESLQTLSDSLMQLLQIFGVLIVLAGVLLIINIQLMNVEEREQQVGLLRAIGTQQAQILMTTVVETILLGVIGSVIGIIGGILYGRILSISMAWTLNYSVNEVPIFPPDMSQVVIMSFFIGFMLALVTSILPAWKASRINIVWVMRGILPLEEKKFGMKGFYFGIILILLGVALIASSGLEPWKEEAWRRIDDAEVLYYMILFPIVGSALCSSYFFNKRWSLNIMASVLLLWPFLTGIYIIPELVTKGTGGAYLILGMLLSLCFGTCILIGVNLDYVASTVHKTLGAIAGMKSITIVAMGQMARKKMRSTLVFAIFSVILTMNIFLATFSYSFRYGADDTVELLAGGADIVMVAGQPVPITIPLETLIQQQFADDGVDSVHGFSQSEELIPFFLDDKAERGFSHRIIPINPSSLWTDKFSFEGWKIQFELSGTKIQQLETFSGFDITNPATQEENERAWRAIANDETSNVTGYPLAIVRSMGQGVLGEPVVKVGNTIWLEHQTAGLIEFTVAALHSGNVLTDWPAAFNAPSVGGIFISEQQALRLQGFEDGIDTKSLFIVGTEHPVRSKAVYDIADTIMAWANAMPDTGSAGLGETGWLRQNHGFYGITAIPSWEIYEVGLDGFYRIMTFLQLFTSGGFLVGILGLIVVSMRSIHERKREIGMMRSLGFRKLNVTFAVLLELVVMGLIGLLVGLVNGAFMGYVLINLNYGMDFLIPWDVVIFYTTIILSSALFAAIIPGWLASRIPPSDALRYSG